MAARELPARPSLEQYKKQAKDLLEHCRSGDPEALRRIQQQHSRLAKLADAELHHAKLALADAQFAIAREHGFESWPKFAKHIEALMGERLPATVWRLAEDAVVGGDVTTLERLLRDHGALLRKEHPRSSWSGGLAPHYDAPDARSIIARNHHFESWDQFEAHTAALKDGTSTVAQFEAAVDAIVRGDVDALAQRLRRDPELIGARSTRTHHSTLLHYVGANGVEEFRQRTPKNAVQVLEALLSADPEVDAVADVYGGATTLGLVSTSIHPKLAGLQEALIDMLLARGARMDHPAPAGNAHSLVNGCLANGRGEAAEFLASRGAPLDLEGAAGVGRLEIVRSFFDAEGGLKPTATMAQMMDGFAWACEYGRTNVVEFLLDRGIDVDARLPRHGILHGQTALHWAALGGNVDTVKALLKRRAAVDAKDETFGTTPLSWALYAWSNDGAAPPERYHQVVALLVAAGSTVEPDWLAAEKVRVDDQMFAALSGEMKPQ